MTNETAVDSASRPFDSDAVLAPEGLPTEFGGYRVVRVLSRAECATMAVVHAQGETRVARLYSTTCPSEIIDRALEVYDAIARADRTLKEHVVALHDLVTVPDGRLALILELVAGPALDDVLAARRGQLSIGEAVTILAPLADALEAAHGVGLTGMSLTTADVRFSTSGAPVVGRLTDARPGPVLPDRFRALEPDYANDVAAFQRLGSAVASAVVDGDRAGLTATLAAPRGTRRLSTELFDLALPMPVLLHAPTAPGNDLGPLAPTAPPLPTASTAPTAPPNTSSGASSAPSVSPQAPRWILAALDTLTVLGLPMSVTDRVRAVAQGLVIRGAGVGESAAPMVERVRGVRRGYLVAGAGGVVALVAALTLVTIGAADGNAGAAGVSVTESRGEASARPVGEGAGDDSASTLPHAPGTPTPTLDGGTPESVVDPSADEWPAIIEELIDRWRECHAAFVTADPGVDVGCASDVAHAGSAAERLIGHDDPRHAVIEGWSEQGGESVVRERMGGAALIDLLVPPAAEPTTSSAPTAATTAASLLVVRSEAGWRVRDVLVDDLVD